MASELKARVTGIGNQHRSMVKKYAKALAKDYPDIPRPHFEYQRALFTDQNRYALWEYRPNGPKKPDRKKVLNKNWGKFLFLACLTFFTLVNCLFMQDKPALVIFLSVATGSILYVVSKLWNNLVYYLIQLIILIAYCYGALYLWKMGGSINLLAAGVIVLLMLPQVHWLIDDYLYGFRNNNLSYGNAVLVALAFLFAGQTSILRGGHTSLEMIFILAVLSFLPYLLLAFSFKNNSLALFGTPFLEEDQWLKLRTFQENGKLYLLLPPIAASHLELVNDAKIGGMRTKLGRRWNLKLLQLARETGCNLHGGCFVLARLPQELIDERQEFYMNEAYAVAKSEKNLKKKKIKQSW